MNLPRRLLNSLRALGRFGGWALLSWVISSPAQQVEVPAGVRLPVAIESAEISAEVTGRFAVTTFDVVVHNPNPETLEASFVFPLLPSQEVVGFAMDVDGAMREAVPVESARPVVVIEGKAARAPFPVETSGALSPAFRARVYPLTGQGQRRIRISCREPLTTVGERPGHRINLDFAQPLKRFRLSLNVHTGTTFPPATRTTLDLQLPPWRDGQFMEMERTDFEGRGFFEILLPRPEYPRVLTGRFHGREYFYAEIPVTPLLFARPTPKVIGLLWDTSASGAERNRAEELALLDAWFSELQNVDVRLVRFRDRVSRPESHSVRNGEWQALRRELESSVYDGGSSLEGLVDDARVEAWVLFTDGRFNFGPDLPRSTLPLGAPVHTFVSSTRSNLPWLRAVAAASGGEHVDLLHTPTSNAAFALQAQSMRLLGADLGQDAITHLYPAPGASIDGEILAVTGVLRKREAALRLQVGHNPENSQTLEVQLISGDNPSMLAPQAWASARIAALSADPETNEADIHETSREFVLPTANSTLVVLESVAEFIHHGIFPPDPLRRDWEARRAADATSKKKQRDRHLDRVVQAFEKHLTWWETAFPKGTPPGSRSSGPAHPEQKADPGGRPPIPFPSVIGVAPSPTPNPADAVDTAAALPTEPAGRPSNGFGSGSGRGRRTVVLNPWNPEDGYRERLRQVSADRRRALYVEERASHSRNPGFFLDAADIFAEGGDLDMAVRVVSNLAEFEAEDAGLLRMLAHRLTQLNRPDIAVKVFERVLKLRPDEPQSFRDLALACSVTGQHQKAVDLLAEIVNRSWDVRFPGIELIAAAELNAIAATSGQNLDLSRLDPRLRRVAPMDFRAVLTWDASDFDVDLWVTDPNGETARFEDPLTYQGGLLSQDFAGAYGPEEYTVREAKPGSYRVRLNSHGDRRQHAFGPVSAQVRLITGFGTPQQQERSYHLRLNSRQETIDVGTVDLGVARRTK